MGDSQQHGCHRKEEETHISHDHYVAFFEVSFLGFVKF